MTHKHDVGYELQTSIAISDSTGKAIAPIAQNMISADKQLSTYTNNLQQDSHLNELSKRMDWIAEQQLEKPILHIIDREADSAYHIRAWAESGHQFLLRAKGNNTLTYQDKTQKTQDIANSLNYGKFKRIKYKNKFAILKVAQADVVLERKAKPKSFDDDGNRTKPLQGKPLPLKLTCTRIEDNEGNLLAKWFLLSNNSSLSKFELAQFYYYRWEIESYFKLLKSSGHQMEKLVTTEYGSLF